MAIIFGVDEVDLSKGHCQLDLAHRPRRPARLEGDAVKMRRPAGEEEIEIVKVQYVRGVDCLPAKVGLSGIPGISGRERGVGSREGPQSIDIVVPASVWDLRETRLGYLDE